MKTDDARKKNGLLGAIWETMNGNMMSNPAEINETCA
jgi:hypothetical protein